MKFVCEECGYKTKDYPHIRKVIKHLKRDGSDPTLLKIRNFIGVICMCPRCSAFHVRNLVCS